MQPAGLAKIELAKQNGSWEILDDVENLVIPPELEKAFKLSPKAFQAYKNKSPSIQKSFLHRIKMAKLPQTKLNRIEKIIEELLG
jgi:uncharacterized protein YdeI (YjbR/CyaY-like superfamily)